jgi:hypothetical protein
MKRIVAILLGFAWSFANAGDHVDKKALPPPSAITASDKDPILAPLPPLESEKQDYAWDEFKHWDTMLWQCRNVKTGDFVSSKYCSGKSKVDSHWPDKTTPPNWSGQRLD